MNILKRISQLARECPEREALRCGGQSMAYGELWGYSEALAAWLLAQCPKERSPVAVYGHKSPWMVVCFLACVKSGRAYCPIDVSVPLARAESILEALPSRLALAVEPYSGGAGGKQVVTLAEIRATAGAQHGGAAGEGAFSRAEREEPAGNGAGLQPQTDGSVGEGIRFRVRTEVSDGGGTVPAPAYGKSLAPEENWVQGGETFYIIFTSGSTGTPKGVQISADCLNHYLDWAVTLGGRAEEKRGKVFLNQAPFSFDLSVMDLYTCLASGGTLYCLEKTVQSDYRLLMQSLRESGAAVWVSTPSFAEVCLGEKGFDSALLPALSLFLFCGETLGNRTAAKLMERFPTARIVNTYGPTESTVAVTEVLVTRELNEAENPLPVGRPKPGTRIEIRDAEGRALPEGEKGEIVILGDTVSAGYYGQPELTRRSFFWQRCGAGAGREDFEEAAPGTEWIRGYRTGDEGYLRDGMLYYCGRMDLQVKLHGYRIELGDIENNLRRLEGVEHAVVLPHCRGARVASLTAFVAERTLPEDEQAEAARLREGLKKYLPDYMVPKKIQFLEQMPMTANGKADRKSLEGRIR